MQVKYDTRAVNLPVLRVLMRSDFPCLRSQYTPNDPSGYFRDEMRRDMSPCPRHPYFETRIDLRYDRVAGDLEINQGDFEDENGLTAIWEDRYDKDGLAENSLIRQVRKQGRYRAYSRGTVGWALDCELDSRKISRQEAFDDILNREIKS